MISYFLDHLDEVVGRKLADSIREHSQPALTLALSVPEVARAQYFSKQQCEEVFCDIVGTRIFGASYLRAFAYLIFPSPKSQERRNFEYPGNVARVRYMKQAAKRFVTPVPEEFGEDFDDILPRDLVGARRHMVLAADTATENAFSRLLAEVERLFPASLMPSIDNTSVSTLAELFKKRRPGDGIYRLPDIIEAAWDVHLGVVGNRGANLFEYLRSLNEIVFKTIEVSEFYRRIDG